jgi:hypothetical protein
MSSQQRGDVATNGAPWMANRQSGVKAVQEPGYANVWSLQDEMGNTIARLTVCDQAATWARKIEDALNVEATAGRNAAGDADKAQAEMTYVTDGVKIVEAALAKAELANPDDAPFGMDASQSAAYVQGLAAGYRHALEMMAPPRPVLAKG